MKIDTSTTFLSAMMLAPALFALALFNPALAMGSTDGLVGNPPVIEIDRFSDQSGHLFKRGVTRGLPCPNEPIDFDKGPLTLVAAITAPAVFAGFDDRLVVNSVEGTQTRAVPGTSGSIVCHPKDNADYRFSTLTLLYQLTLLQPNDYSHNADVTGTYDLDSCNWGRQGSISGVLTPAIWYGDAFVYGGDLDVKLDIIDGDGQAMTSRLFVLRDGTEAYLWTKDKGEPVALECAGDILN